jgi:hypothetical protein
MDGNFCSPNDFKAAANVSKEVPMLSPELVEKLTHILCPGPGDQAAANNSAVKEGHLPELVLGPPGKDGGHKGSKSAPSESRDEWDEIDPGFKINTDKWKNIDPGFDMPIGQWKNIDPGFDAKLHPPTFNHRPFFKENEPHLVLPIFRPGDTDNPPIVLPIYRPGSDPGPQVPIYRLGEGSHVQLPIVRFNNEGSAKDLLKALNLNPPTEKSGQGKLTESQWQEVKKMLGD